MELLFLFGLLTLHYAGGEYLKWPQNYYFKAILNIPSANLAQPYEVWANGVRGNLRLDFYNGLSKIYKKRNGNNVTVPFRYYWVGPESTSFNLNNTVCRLLTNTSREAKLINTYLQPSFYTFMKSGQEADGTTKWEYQYHGKYDAIYHFALWTMGHGTGRVPIRYEYRMTHKGTELDFRQHIYERFAIAKPDPAMFKIPTGLSCKPSSVNNIDETFDWIIRIVSPIPEYNMTEEFERYIQSMNRQQGSYKLAVNHLTDLTENELSGLLGAKVDPEQQDLPDFEDDDVIHDLEDGGNFDWRWFNASSPVKDVSDQTNLCGSCYAFASAAAVESAAYISKGCKDMEEASEQALIDCSRGQDRTGNDGCNGGLVYDSLKWIKAHGIPLRKDYGPYLAMEGYCNLHQPRFLHISGHEKLENKVKSIKEKLRQRGPLAALINVPQSLFFYEGGIYDDKSCLSGPKNMTHAILIVGFGKENDRRYWIIKNSYGSNWGDGGYFKLDMANNLCGVTNAAYAIIYENSPVKKCKRNNFN